ncbi:MAG: mobilization protein [Asticcacaulis sp.]
MARKSIEERLAQLEAQRRTLQARLSKQERARDTRRKVLLGAFILHRLETGRASSADYLAEFIRRELPTFLTRDTDKALFADLVDTTNEQEPSS